MEGQSCPHSSAKLSKAGLETFLVLSSQYKVSFDRPLVENSRHSNPHSLLDQDPGSGEEKKPQAVTAPILHIASVPFGKAMHSTSQQYPTMIFQVWPHTSTAMWVFMNLTCIYIRYILSIADFFSERRKLFPTDLTGTTTSANAQFIIVALMVKIPPPDWSEG